MSLFFRSYFFQLIAPFFLSTIILTFVISLNTVYKLINLIIERGVGIEIVFLLLTYQLPQFISTTLPYAALVATVIFLSRLSSEFEITAMYASGINTWKIGFPIIVFGFCATLMGLLNSLWITPLGYNAFEKEKIKLLQSRKTKNIQPKVLNYDFSGKVLYVQEKNKNEMLEGVFFTDQELNKDSMITFSDRGFIEIREDERDLVLNLEEGQIHLNENKNIYRIINFKKFHYIFTPPTISMDKTDGHVWGKSTINLLKSKNFGDRRELMMRITTPLASFALSFTMISLGIVEPRRGRSASYLRGLILIFIYYSLWLGANELMKYSSPKLLWMPFLITLLFGLFNIIKVDFKLESSYETFKYFFSKTFRESIHG